MILKNEAKVKNKGLRTASIRFLIYRCNNTMQQPGLRQPLASILRPHMRYGKVPSDIS